MVTRRSSQPSRLSGSRGVARLGRGCPVLSSSPVLSCPVKRDSLRKSWKGVQKRDSSFDPLLRSSRSLLREDVCLLPFLSVARLLVFGCRGCGSRPALSGGCYAIAMAMKGCGMTCSRLCTDVAAVWFVDKVQEEGSFAADASNEGSSRTVARIPWPGGQEGWWRLQRRLLPPLAGGDLASREVLAPSPGRKRKSGKAGQSSCSGG